MSGIFLKNNNPTINNIKIEKIIRALLIEELMLGDLGGDGGEERKSS